MGSSPGDLLEVGQRVKVKYRHSVLGPREIEGRIIGIRQFRGVDKFVILPPHQTSVETFAPGQVMEVEILDAVR